MGLARITRIRQQLERLPSVMESEVGNAVALHMGDIEQLQKEQLLSGRGKDGEKLEPKYKSGPYAKKKNTQNPEPGKGTPDLRLTGAFHRSIKGRAYQSEFELAPTDFKAKYLTPRYPNAIGLNIINIVRIRREMVLPFLRRRVRELINP